MPSKYRTVQVVDGSWYAMSGFDRDICCDCGLTHDTQFKLEDGRIMFRTKVNQRETAKHRKEHNIKVIRGSTAVK
jgi:hypothetical protein